MNNQNYNLGGYTPNQNLLEGTIFNTNDYQLGQDYTQGIQQPQNGLNLGSLGGLFDKAGGLGNFLGGLGELASVFNGFRQNGIAKDTLNFQKQAYQTNLGNQTKSYNTALQDRITSRYAQEGRNPESAQQYIDANKL